jgi:transposase
MALRDSEEAMGRGPYSDDLRARVVAAVAEGCSRRAAGKRFAVSASSSIRWVELHEETGSVSPRQRDGKSRSPLEPHAAWLLELVDQEPDLTLAEIVERLLQDRGVRTSDSSVDRFFQRHGVSFKKNSARGRAGAARRGRGAAMLEGQSGKP